MSNVPKTLVPLVQSASFHVNSFSKNIFAMQHYVGRHRRHIALRRAFSGLYAFKGILEIFKGMR